MREGEEERAEIKRIDVWGGKRESSMQMKRRVDYVPWNRRNQYHNWLEIEGIDPGGRI